MRSRILVGLIAGTLGGFLGWLLQERLINYNAIISGDMPVEAVRTMVFCVGGLIGLFLGAVDGIVEVNARKLLSGLVLGALSGVLLGSVGLTFGQVVFSALGGSSHPPANPNILSFAQQIIARAFGWAFMGIGLGIGSALVTRSPKRILHGAVGGLLGGFLGGVIFDLLARGSSPVQQAMGASGYYDAGGPSRMVGFTAIGGLTGFFIGLVEELLKQAWVKVLAGRNEGKDFTLSKPMNLLGRDERCDVPLYGDMSVGVQHAAIRADGRRHVLIDANAPGGTLVNGQRVPPGGELLLRDGDMIQIGAHRILFREKATQSRFARDPVDVPKAKATTPGAVPMPSHLCPYCGAAKDIAGNCRCSLTGLSSAASSENSLAAAPMGGTTGNGVYPSPDGLNAGGVGVSYAVGMGGAGGVGTAPRGGLDMPRLVGVEGAYTGQVFLLTRENMLLGREPDKDIVLAADSTISRNHARIVNENGSFAVYDNGSANGTFVNNLRVSMQILAPGDIVQFGASKFRFE